MAHRIYVLLIQALNIGFIWFSSTLAIEGRMPIFWAGLVGICFFTVLAFRLISIGAASAAITVSWGTIPALWLLGMFLALAESQPIPVFSGLATFTISWLFLVSKSQNRTGISKPWRINFSHLSKTKFSVIEKFLFYCISLLSVFVGVFILLQRHT